MPCYKAIQAHQAHQAPALQRMVQTRCPVLSKQSRPQRIAKQSKSHKHFRNRCTQCAAQQTDHAGSEAELQDILHVAAQRAAPPETAGRPLVHMLTTASVVNNPEAVVNSPSLANCGYAEFQEEAPAGTDQPISDGAPTLEHQTSKGQATPVISGVKNATLRYDLPTPAVAVRNLVRLSLASPCCLAPAAF